MSILGVICDWDLLVVSVRDCVLAWMKEIVVIIFDMLKLIILKSFLTHNLKWGFINSKSTYQLQLLLKIYYLSNMCIILLYYLLN